MNREVHVRFWEGVGVKFSRATQLIYPQRAISVDLPIGSRAVQSFASGLLRIGSFPASFKGVNTPF